MLRDLKIKWKLYFGFGLILIFTLIMFVTNFWELSKIDNATFTTQHTFYPIMKQSNELKLNSMELQRWFIELAAERSMATYAEGMVQSQERLDKFNVMLDKLIEASPEHEEQLNQIRYAFENYFTVGLKTVQAYAINNDEMASELKQEFSAEGTALQEQIDIFYGDIESQFNDGLTNISDKTASANTKSGLIGLVAILLGMVMAYIAARIFTKPIYELTEVAKEVAKGNLNHSVTIKSKDEIGVLAGSFRHLIQYMNELADAAQMIASNNLTVTVTPKSEADILGNSFKTMVVNLRNIISKLSRNSLNLVSAATQISDLSTKMSEGAVNQSHQVNQVSIAVEQMTATILESSRNASEVSGASRNASETAADGGRIVHETIEGMHQIAEVVKQSSESITKLAESANQIGEVIQVIDDIADQTNLLALNAAIEAARAGEQGRGFAVVADEVRKLAERTGKATGEIANMIKGIQADTDNAVKSMESGITQVDKGRELTDKAGNALQDIMAMSQQVMDMISQITSAFEEQSTAAEEISKNMEHISTITKDNSGGAEESSSAAEVLNTQAEELKQIVSEFQL